MKADMGQVMDEQRSEAGREIDYLKALRTRNIRNIICGMAAAAAVAMTAVGVKLFVIGSPSEAYMITYLDVDQEQILCMAGTKSCARRTAPRNWLSMHVWLQAGIGKARLT